MINSLFSELVHDFFSLLYPRYCLGCMNALAKGEEHLCTGCFLEMPHTNYHLETNNPLYERLSLRFPLGQAVAFLRFSKNGRVQQVLHALKYRRYPEIGITIGKVYGTKLREAGLLEVDCIVPVPLHIIKQRKRGYNQSEKFGEGLAQALKVECYAKALERKVMTETQTRKTKLKRWQNVNEVFILKETQQLAGKHVLLVDDVVTTGATLEACVHAILQSGCKQVSIACIAEA